MGELGDRILEYLSTRNDIKIIGVDTKVDREGQKDCEAKIKELKLPRKSYEEIVKLKPDMFLCIYYLKIITKELLDNCLVINLHSAKLPEYRGRNGFAYSIQNNDATHTVTLHLVDEAIDTGDIIAERTAIIDINETSKTLYEKMQKIAFHMFVDEFPNIIKGEYKTRKQLGEPRYYGKNLDKLLDMNDDPQKIYNKIRSLSFPPYEPAYFMRGGKKIHLTISDVDYDLYTNTIRLRRTSRPKKEDAK
jgi:methionyl-tRNA formyltransferase